MPEPLLKPAAVNLEYWKGEGRGDARAAGPVLALLSPSAEELAAPKVRAALERAASGRLEQLQEEYRAEAFEAYVSGYAEGSAQ